MKQVETSIQIKATPLEVWSVLTDLPAYKEWNPVFVDAKVNGASGSVVEDAHAVDGGDLSEGLPHSAEGSAVTLYVQVQNSKAPRSTTPTITQCSPGTDLRWLAVLWSTWLFSGEEYFCLKATEGETDSTTLVHGERWGGILLPLLSFMLNGAKSDFVKMNEALRQRVEQKYHH